MWASLSCLRLKGKESVKQIMEESIRGFLQAQNSDQTFLSLKIQVAGSSIRWQAFHSHIYLHYPHAVKERTTERTSHKLTFFSFVPQNPLLCKGPPGKAVCNSLTSPLLLYQRNMLQNIKNTVLFYDHERGTFPLSLRYTDKMLVYIETPKFFFFIPPNKAFGKHQMWYHVCMSQLLLR